MLIVALVTASNDYSKELQFRALEKTSEEGNRAMVLRDGSTQEVSQPANRVHNVAAPVGHGDCLMCCNSFSLFFEVAPLFLFPIIVGPSQIAFYLVVISSVRYTPKTWLWATSW